jgi:hypothetical protein
LGQGSFALIASGAGGDARAVDAESFDLVAGEMRLRGAGASVVARRAASAAHRPAGGGTPAAARLVGRGDRPLELRRLAALDAEVALDAARVEAPGLPMLEGASVAVNLSAGTLRLETSRRGSAAARSGAA